MVECTGSGGLPGYSLDALLVIHDANAPIHLPGNAIAASTPERRYAAGEITSEEYEERRAKLLRDANVK